MKNVDKNKIVFDAMNCFGDKMEIVVVEELCELQKATTKASRGKLDKDNMIEEIADCLICIEMLQHKYEIDNEQIIDKFVEKVNRLKTRMDNGELK